MATATITFTETEDGGVEISCSFEPALKPKDLDNAPPSAVWALSAMNAIKKQQSGDDDFDDEDGGW